MYSFLRGDTFLFKVKIELKNGNPVKMSDIETLFVTCKNGFGNSAVEIFRKTKDEVELDENGYLHVIFKSEDTQDLEVGNYVFDIEVTLKDGYRKSKKGQFTLEYDVTDHKGE